jgi:putative CocE/NonD family hydrolase
MARTSTPFHAYEIGARRWVETTAWPPPAARVRSLWFGPGRTGTAPLSGNDGSLTAKPPAAGGFDTVRWTGANSPCSRMTDQELIWGFLKTEQDTVGFGYENDCTFDDRSAAAGSLTYTSRPLERPLTIAGPGNVTVYAKATTKNTQWVVTLDDVAPDGGSRPLATGDLIGSLRALDRRRTWFLDGKPIAPYHPFTRASEAAVTPGTVTRYDVELPSILARIAKGHRIRILVQTSDRPYLEPKGPDTAQLFGGVYEVQRTPLAASFANLPVVAPERLRTSTVDWGDCVTDC